MAAMSRWRCEFLMNGGGLQRIGISEDAIMTNACCGMLVRHARAIFGDVASNLPRADRGRARRSLSNRC